MNCLKKSIVIDSLPPEVLVVIFNKLNIRDVKSARQVCKKWKCWIDYDLPLKVLVDDRKEGNCKFVKKVWKDEIRVISHNTVGINSALRSPRRANSLRKISVYGTIHPDFFIKVVPQFQGLEELIIGGEALSRPLNLHKPFTLPNLKILQLYSVFHKESPEQDLQEIVIPVAKNTIEFLMNIKCPQIRALLIDGDVDQIQIPKEYEWKGKALMTFMRKHRDSLKKILIGESCILKANPRRGHDRNFPTKLRSLHFSFYGNQHVFLERNVMWFKLLADQCELQLLNIGALWYNHTKDLLMNLPITMRHLAIYWNLDTNPAFDCEIIAKLTNLLRLELTFDGNYRQTFINMLSLRACTKLKMLVSEQGAIPAADLEQFNENFPNLEVLYLYQCRNDYTEVQGMRCGITNIAIKNMLCMRKLEYFFCTSADFLGDKRTVAKMIDMLSPFRQSSNVDGSDIIFHAGVEPEIPDDVSLD